MNRRDFLARTGVTAFSLRTGYARQGKTGAPRPNILFCVADDVSYPHLSAYGCRWIRTPGFDRVAREGLLFTRAYTPNAKCAPSRACILTGRNSWQLEEAANHWCYFPGKFRSFPEVLAAHGYHVGFTQKGWGPGVALGRGGRPRSLTGKPYNSRKTTPPAAFLSDCDYAANFEDFLDARPSGQPFCFWYGSTEPHRPTEFRAGIERGGRRIADVDAVPGFWPDNETVRTDMLDYAYEIEYFDRHLARMLATLERRGVLENTLIVVTADNGMAFPRVKGQAYEYSNHMPLAVMWKAGTTKPGRRVDDHVSFIDFAPTFLELAGVTEASSGMQKITGRSLADIFSSPKSGIVDSGRNLVLVGKERHDVGRPGDVGYPIRGIVKGDYLYLRNFETSRWPAGNPETGYLNCDGSPTKTECLKARQKAETRRYWELCFGKRDAEELYCVAKDPECLNNLAGKFESRETKAALSATLSTALREQKDPRMFGNGQIFDQYPYADEKNRHFYERYMKGENIEAPWVNESDFEKLVPE